MSTLLIWEWKQEPVSPPTNEELSVSEDVVLYGTSPEYYNDKLDIEFDPCETKAEIATKLLEGLDQLEDLSEYIQEDINDLIKDEPFSNWLEEKMLPMFEDVTPAHGAVAVIPVIPVKVEQAIVPDTQSLLQEFEIVFDAVEMTHCTLTPPQSPTYKPYLTTLESLSVQQPTYPLTEKPLFNDELDSTIDLPTTIQQTDVAHEMAVVDELIRSRADDLIQYPSSPGSNSSSSNSNFGDCSSDDPEWIPETIDPSTDFEPSFEPASRKRSKPYSRGQNVDKKSRKKEQNKNAATRYRMKKKAEVEDILEEERLVGVENSNLENQITDLQREIKYLKGLMRDLFKAKGLLN